VYDRPCQQIYFVDGKGPRRNTRDVLSAFSHEDMVPTPQMSATVQLAVRIEGRTARFTITDGEYIVASAHTPSMALHGGSIGFFT